MLEYQGQCLPRRQLVDQRKSQPAQVSSISERTLCSMMAILSQSFHSRMQQTLYPYSSRLAPLMNHQRALVASSVVDAPLNPPPIPSPIPTSAPNSNPASASTPSPTPTVKSGSNPLIPTPAPTPTPTTNVLQCEFILQAPYSQLTLTLLAARATQYSEMTVWWWCQCGMYMQGHPVQ